MRETPRDNRLSPEDRLLICCAGVRDADDAGESTCAEISGQLDWDGVVEKSIRHGVASLLHLYLSGSGVQHEVPPDVARRLERVYYANAMRAVQAEEQLCGILRPLGSNGVETILLKGLHLSKSIYRNVASRPTGDIDLLIKRQDIGRTDRLLREIGFDRAPGSFPLRYYRGIHFHLMYVGGRDTGSIPLEIHWDLKDRFTILGFDMDEIWAGAGRWKIGDSATNTMCPDHLLAYLCYHADKHTCFSRYIYDFSQIEPDLVLGNAVSAELLWYADILRLIHLEGDGIRWDRLAEHCRKWGIEGEVYASLAVTDKVFRTSVAAEPLGLLSRPKPRRLQAAVCRRLMAPAGSAGARAQGTGRRRLLESGTGLQFRPFKLLDILDYMFPEPGLFRRAFSVRGPKLALRYTGHVVEASLRIVYSLGLLVCSAGWKTAVRIPALRRMRGSGSPEA